MQSFFNLNFRHRIALRSNGFLTIIKLHIFTYNMFCKLCSRVLLNIHRNPLLPQQDDWVIHNLVVYVQFVWHVCYLSQNIFLVNSLTMAHSLRQDSSSSSFFHLIFLINILTFFLLSEHHGLNHFFANTFTARVMMRPIWNRPNTESKILTTLKWFW